MSPVDTRAVAGDCGAPAIRRDHQCHGRRPETLANPDAQFVDERAVVLGALADADDLDDVGDDRARPAEARRPVGALNSASARQAVAAHAAGRSPRPRSGACAARKKVPARLHAPRRVAGQPTGLSRVARATAATAAVRLGAGDVRADNRARSGTADRAPRPRIHGVTSRSTAARVADGRCANARPHVGLGDERRSEGICSARFFERGDRRVRIAACDGNRAITRRLDEPASDIAASVPVRPPPELDALRPIRNPARQKRQSGETRDRHSACARLRGRHRAPPSAAVRTLSASSSRPGSIHASPRDRDVGNRTVVARSTRILPGLRQHLVRIAWLGPGA